jgi:iron complex transport system substrate-binding protein
MTAMRRLHRIGCTRAAALLFATALLPVGLAQAQPVRVTDDTGAVIELARPAQRIVSLSPHLTELLFAAGAGAQVVGVDDASDYPPQAQQRPRIGSSSTLDYERLLALKPDLVVAWSSGNPARLVARLRGLGLPIYHNEIRRFGDIATTLRRLGALAGTGEAAEARAQQFEAPVLALRERYADRPTLRVFHQIWAQPLITVNGHHLISQAIELCGGRNVFADARELTPQVDIEAVLRADPDVIVTSAPVAGEGDNLQRWRRLRTLRATREGNLITIDADTLHRATDRIFEGTRELCKKLDAARSRQRR